MWAQKRWAKHSQVLCKVLFDRLRHHEPSDKPNGSYFGSGRETPRRTSAWLKSLVCSPVASQASVQSANHNYPTIPANLPWNTGRISGWKTHCNEPMTNFFYGTSQDKCFDMSSLVGPWPILVSIHVGFWKNEIPISFPWVSHGLKPWLSHGLKTMAPWPRTFWPPAPIQQWWTGTSGAAYGIPSIKGSLG